MKRNIYLDNNATTFLAPSVIKKMSEALKIKNGNPSSVHSFGRKVKQDLIEIREDIASFLQINPKELIFTSGGTESLNMIMRGIFEPKYSGHLISSNLEHSSVYETSLFLKNNGCHLTLLEGGLYGAVSPEDVQKSIRPDTKLIVLTAVNSETGVKADIENIASIAYENGIPFLVDGVALMGKEIFHIPKGVSAMCFSAHKFHGPKGVGMAFLRPSIKINPLLFGGGQEYNKRSGTENVLGIIGMHEAIRLLKSELPEASKKMESLRNRFERKIMDKIPEVNVNGKGPRIANTSNLAFPNVGGESLLMNLDLEGLAASHGSACSSGGVEISRILLNMNIPPSLAKNSIRFSFSRFTTEKEADESAEIILRVVSQMQERNGLK